MTSPHNTLVFRCPPELRSAIERAAADDEINSSAFIRRTLRRALERAGYLPPRDPPPHQRSAAP
jgi:hypothetical protein